MNFTLSPFRILPALVILSSQQAFSQTWDGGGNNSNWGTQNNWDPNQVPGNNADVTFGTAFTSGTSISLGNGTRTIGDLTINNVTNFSLINGTLALDNVTRSATGGTTTIGSAVTLRQNTSWDIATGGTLQVNGLVTDTDSQSYSFNKAGGGTLFLNGTAGFDGALTVSAGRLILAGDNNTSEDLESAISVSSGAVLEIRHADALGTTGTGSATTVASGGALEIRGGITTAAEALTLSGTGISSGGALRNVADNNTFTGLITLNGATRINSDAGLLTLNRTAAGAVITGTNQNLTFGGAGNITVTDAFTIGSGSLTKDGAGTLILSAANTFTGGAGINGGTVQLGNANALNGNAVNIASGANLQLNNNAITIAGLSGAGNVIGRLSGSGTTALTVNKASGSDTFTGVISNGSGTLGLTKSGAGTLVLSGSNTYTGATNVNAGTLVINGTQSSATGTITVASNARLQGTGTTGAATTTIQTGGTLAAGLNFTGNLAFQSQSVFEWDISADGTSFSPTNVGGALTGNGAIFSILLSDFSDDFWSVDQSWDLAQIFSPGAGSAANLAAIFSSISSSATAVNGGRGFSFNSSTGDLQWAAIPEPTSALAGVLLGAGLLRRRRARA